MQKGNILRTGFSPWEVPTKLSKGPAWTWRDLHDDTIRATPLIDDKKNIYLTTIAGRIYKFSPSGTQIWQVYLSKSLPVVGSLYDGKIFLPTKTGHLVAVSMETGQELWSAPVSERGVTAGDTASVMAVNGTIVSATHDNPQETSGGNAVVVAVRAKDGSVLWRFKPDINVYNFQGSAPGDGTVVFQDRSGGVYRIGLADGRLIWKSGKQGPGFSQTMTTGAAVCFQNKVYAVSNLGGWTPLESTRGALHVYDVATGKFLWEQILEYAANQAVTIGPNPNKPGGHIAVVGIGSNPGFPPIMGWGAYPTWIALTVHRISMLVPTFFTPHWGVDAAMEAYDAETGAKLWRLQLPKYRQPATAGDTERVVRRFTDQVSGVNPYNDPICLPDSCSQPVVGPDGTAYQGWQDGTIYAVKDANGDGQIDEETEVSKYQVSDGFQGSLGLAPGILAAAPCGGGLYVFKQ